MQQMWEHISHYQLQPSVGVVCVCVVSILNIRPETGLRVLRGAAELWSWAHLLQQGVEVGEVGCSTAVPAEATSPSIAIAAYMCTVFACGVQVTSSLLRCDVIHIVYSSNI